jgi:uncharacterized protein with beta-barrel porin domain
MRLLVLSYRLTKIKGVLVSVGICALTNATFFMGTVAGAAGLSLAMSGAAQAGPTTVPGCNASNGDGTIATSTTGTSYLWTAPTNCTVTAGTIWMTGADALTASGALLTHDSLSNQGYIHASLTGTVLSGATISGFSNLVNVGSIDNTIGATITGDYLTVGGSVVSPVVRPFTTGSGLIGSDNTFKIYGVNNQSTATIGSLSNEGTILGTIDSGIGVNTVQLGIVVGVNNDGSITGTLSNTGLISASFGKGVAPTGNDLFGVGIASSNYIGALANSGSIGGDFAGIVNGNINEIYGPSTLAGISSTIGQLSNSGTIAGGYAGLLNAGQIGGITNSGFITGYIGIAAGPYSSIGAINNTTLGGIIGAYAAIAIEGTLGALTNSGYIAADGYGAIVAEPNSTIGTINNQTTGGIVGSGEAAMVLGGTITTLTNSGYIGTGGEGGAIAILNGGTIGELSNGGTISAEVTGLVNVGGTIGSVNNSGVITGGNTGLVNVTGSLFTSIGQYGSINSLVNSGFIGGNNTGIYNNGGIGLLSNTSDGTVMNGTITGGTVGLYNQGSIGTFSNASGAVLQATNASNATALLNTGFIGAVTNAGLIQGPTGVVNNGTIVSFNNTSSGVVAASAGDAIANVGGSIGVLSNAGLIETTNTNSNGGGFNAIFNDSNSTIGQLTNTGTIISSATTTMISSYQETAIVNQGVIGTLTNSGLISGALNGAGINNFGSIGLLSNTSYGSLTGTISGGDYGIVNTGGEGGGIIAVLTNGGLISGVQVGIYNSGTIGTMSNSGTITGGWDGLQNYGTITALGNSGLIEGYYVGIGNWGGSIGSLANEQGGTIAAAYTGIYNYGTIATLSNSGQISGGYIFGILNAGTYDSIASSTIGTLTNTGAITGGNSGILNFGVINALNNSGTISGANVDGLVNVGGEGGPGSIGAITNSGVISGYYAGVFNDSTIGTLVNSQNGVITANGTGVVNYGLITQLTNSGLISGFYETGLRNLDSASIGTLANLSGGTIRGGTSGIYNSSTATIGQLSNAGVILGGSTGIDNEGTIGALSNTGLITGSVYGIYNDNVIGPLYNNGVISGVSNSTVASYGIYNEYSITSLTNDRYGTISGQTAVLNDGTIGALANSGAILGGYTGILNYGTIGVLTNTGSGALIVGDFAIANYEASIGSLTNSGIITGRSVGIDNYEGTIDALVNSGQITGGTEGIYSSGLITSLSNQGLISGSLAGVYNAVGGSIGTLSNAGTIAGTAGAGLYNQGTIGSLSNTGHITGVTAGVSNFHGTIAVMTNSGTIEGTGTIGDGVYNSGSIASFTNSGLIQGVNAGLYNAAGAEPTVLVHAQGMEQSLSVIDTLVNSGTITGANYGLENAGTINSLTNSGTISDDSKAGIQNSGTIGTATSSGLISGAAGLVNTGSIGSFDNSGTLTGTLSAGVYVDGGTVGSLSNEGLISGVVDAISIGAGASLGTITNSGKIAGNIVNASTNELLIAGGSGAVFGTLTGYSGGLGVSDIGQITNTASNVAFTAGNLVLNDHINVGTGTVTSAATLMVDNLIDVKGNYLQTSQGTLSAGVTSVSNHGELDVTSAATVAAYGHVALTPLEGFRFAAGESFTLIEAGSGTYNVANMSALAAGFNGGYLLSEVTTGGQSDLVVCLTNRVTPNCNGVTPAYSVATTSNAIITNNAAGAYSGSNAGLNKLANAVVALGTSPAANRAGNQLLADPHNNAMGLATQPSLDVLNVVTGHADGSRLAANGAESGVSAGESAPGIATWGEAFGGGSHQSEDGQFSGYSMSSEGIVAGGDAVVADSRTRVGAVFTYTHADLHEHGDRTGDTLSLDSYGVLAYGSFLGEHAYADLLAGVLFDQFDTVRVISFTNFNGVATGTHDGTQYVAKASGGYRLPMGESGTTLTPLWGVTYSHLSQDAYTESGGNGAALRVDSENDNSIKGEVGLKLEHNFAVARGDVVPDVRILYRHEFDNGAQFQTASYAVDEASTFSTLDARPIENSGIFSAGVNFLGNDGVTVTLRYTAEAATGYVSQGGSLRVRWTF